MSTPYDSTTKQLFKWEPQSWLRWLGVEAKDIHPINVDMGAIAGAADLAVIIGTVNREAIHAEVQ